MENKDSDTCQKILQTELQSILTKYTVVCMLGKGSQGTIFLVKNGNQDEFCLKVYKLYSKKQCEQIKNEIQICAKLQHPNVVKFFSQHYYREQKMMIAKLEYAQLGNLVQFMSICCSEKQIVHILTQLLVGMEYFHKQHILHRDIKPCNILCCQFRCDKFKYYQQVFKYCDFGVSKVLENTNQQTSTWIGTCKYMSPEQLNGFDYNRKSDIFALGVILYQLIENKYPYPANDIETLKEMIQTHVVSFQNDIISDTLKNLCLSMINPSQISRPFVEDILKLPIIQDELDSVLELYLTINMDQVQRKIILDQFSKYIDITGFNSDSK